MLLEKLPRPEIDELVLEEVPDVSYEDVGGLDSQIEQITDAVELPFLHADLFLDYRLPAPKGILLYGPPGCGKTLIAKAVANSLAKKVAEKTGDKKARSYFLNIKGPELLNKYVGETERQIRLVFQRAREKTEQGWPVIVFFDEMESLFRTRGSGISSDIESTIVPQLLAEIDGVETLRNVIVIGASNREDLIDPAILRPGRLDVKIKIERPERARRRADLRPLPHARPAARRRTRRDLGGGDRNKCVQAMIEATVAEMYREDPSNQFLEVTYQNGEKQILYFKDFSSGAMIENIVRRAKKLAIKRLLAGGKRASAPKTSSRRSTRNTKSTKTCPTPPTPTTGRRSPAKRASASCTSARSSAQRRRHSRSAGARSSASARANTSSHPSASEHRSHGDSEDTGHRDRIRDPGIAAPPTPTTSRRRRCSSTPTSTSWPGRGGAVKPKVGWDFEDETPANDARGYTPLDALPPEVETHLVNAVLTNGARYYVDHAHPELSTPECADALSIVRFDRAAELIVQRSMAAAKKILPPGQELVVYKNNSDGKGNSYGCHENYLMDRHTPFGRIVTHATAVLRQPADLHRRRQGRHRGDGAHGGRRAVPADAAGRLLRGRGRPRDDAEATDHQHPRRAARRPAEVPAPARDRRRRQPVRGRHLPQGGHDRVRADDGRRRLPAPRLRARGAGPGAAAGFLRRDAEPAAAPGRRHHGRRPSTCSGSSTSGPASTPTGGAPTTWVAPVGLAVLDDGNRCSHGSRPTR